MRKELIKISEFQRRRWGGKRYTTLPPGNSQSHPQRYGTGRANRETLVR